MLLALISGVAARPSGRQSSMSSRVSQKQEIHTSGCINDCGLRSPLFCAAQQQERTRRQTLRVLHRVRSSIKHFDFVYLGVQVCAGGVRGVVNRTNFSTLEDNNFGTNLKAAATFGLERTVVSFATELRHSRPNQATVLCFYCSCHQVKVLVDTGPRWVLMKLLSNDFYVSSWSRVVQYAAALIQGVCSISVL